MTKRPTWHVVVKEVTPLPAVIDKKVIVARIVGTLTVLVGGGMLQIALWGKPGEAGLDALLRHGYLWFFYILLGLLIGEHALKWMKRLF